MGGGKVRPSSFACLLYPLRCCFSRLCFIVRNLFFFSDLSKFPPLSKSFLPLWILSPDELFPCTCIVSSFTYILVSNEIEGENVNKKSSATNQSETNLKTTFRNQNSSLRFGEDLQGESGFVWIEGQFSDFFVISRFKFKSTSMDPLRSYNSDLSHLFI